MRNGKVQRVRFTADDRMGLWQAGDEALVLGLESNHPKAPKIYLLKLLRAPHDVIALHQPFVRGLIEPIEEGE